MDFELTLKIIRYKIGTPIKAIAIPTIIRAFSNLINRNNLINEYAIIIP